MAFLDNQRDANSPVERTATDLWGGDPCLRFYLPSR